MHGCGPCWPWARSAACAAFGHGPPHHRRRPAGRGRDGTGCRAGRVAGSARAGGLAPLHGRSLLTRDAVAREQALHRPVAEDKAPLPKSRAQRLDGDVRLLLRNGKDHGALRLDPPPATVPAKRLRTRVALLALRMGAGTVRAVMPVCVGPARRCRGIEGLCAGRDGGVTLGACRDTAASRGGA